MKKGRKILNLIVGCLMILISIIFITTTVFSCIFMQEFVYYTFLAIFLIIIPLPLFIFGIIGIVSATKRVEVYKGKVIYHIGFKNKEYRMSDIKTSKTKSETYRTGLDYGNIVPTYSYYNAHIRIVSAYRNLCDCTSVLLFTNGVVRRDFRWPSFGRKWVALANEEAPAKRKQEREAVDKGATGCHLITIR